MAAPEDDERLWQPYNPAQWDQSTPSLDTTSQLISDLDHDPASSGGGIAREFAEQALSLDIDPQWIDLEDVRQWLYTCDHKERKKCIPDPPEYDGRPLWLIDVVEECVVRAASHPYVALSYVWGGVLSSETTTRNIDLLQRPGVLNENNSGVVIPQTIRHSMKLVGLLGQRHLWVDRFCICQDNAETKHSQLHLMGDIYSNAYLTIIAANGWDADHGLRGIEGVTLPRNFSPHMNGVSYLDHIKPDNAVWYSRGWTFQELLLSRRKLAFINQVVLWECNCGVWHESTGISGRLPGSDHGNYCGVTPDLSLNFNQLNTMSGGMSDYSRLIRAYNSRNLTYAEDGLEAFLGVARRITDVFPEGFVGGLPISNFDMALLWQPDEEVKRRWPRNNRTTSPILLPSWSWVGWEGSIDINSWNYTYPPRQRSEKGPEVEIQGLCKWTHEENGSKVPIHPEKEIEQGTASQVVSRIKNVFTKSGDKCSIPPRVQSYFLYTRAWAVKCRFGQKVPNRSRPTILREIIHAWDGNKVCGTMLMTPNLADGVSEAQIQQVIAISKSGVRRRGLSDLDLKQREPSFARMLADYPSTAACRSKLVTGELFYNYYNVMWISTSVKNGVSRRRALGIMSIEAWNSLKPIEIDVKLG